MNTLLENCKKLVFARCITIGGTKEVPFVIGHVLSIETMEIQHPTSSIFLNTTTLRSNYQPIQIGPFTTPTTLDLVQYGLPRSGDIIVGKTGKNSKGMTFISWLPDRWARPIAYFFHYLLNTLSATRLYENRDPALRMVLLSRLYVSYNGIYDERLYDLLLLILFDDTDPLLRMCYKPEYRSGDGRTWNLSDDTQRKQITAFCEKYQTAHASSNKPIHLPSIPAFVEETSFLLKDSGICAHFRAVLEAHIQDEATSFNSNVHKWLQDPDCLSTILIEELITS